MRGLIIGATMRKTFTFEGKRYEVSAKTEAELYEKIARKKIELEQGKVKESNILVKDYLKSWVETFKEPYVGKATMTMYNTKIKLINDYIGYLRLKDVTSTDIQRIITKEFEKGRSKSHIDKIMLTLSQAMERAVIDRKISYDPTLGITKPKLEENKRRAVTNEERQAILTVAKTHRYGRWIRVMLYMGVRPSETALLQGKDIDFERQELHVRGTKSRAADRFVPIPEPIIDDFRGYTGNAYLFTTSRGNPPSERRIRSWWEAFKRDLDIQLGATVYRNKIIESVIAKDLKLYCLRHTYGTDAVSAGVPIATLSELMGHEDIRTTKKYYIHTSYEARKSAKEYFDKFYEELTHTNSHTTWGK